MPSYETLCSEFKEHLAYRALSTHIGQEVIKKARKAWTLFALLRLWKEGKLEKRSGLPRYWKDRRTGKRTFCVIPVEGAYLLRVGLPRTLPRDLRKEHGGRLVLHTKGVLRFPGTPRPWNSKRCGYVWHADANAALNILLWGSSKGHGAEATPLKPLALRWNRHRWVSRFESSAGTPKAASGSRMAA